MEAGSGADSSAEKHALTKMYEKICTAFPIETAHPALISCYVIDCCEKDEIFQNNPSRLNRVSALLNIISRDVQIEDYRRFNNFLIVLQKTSNCKFLLQGLQQHLQQHRQRVRTSLCPDMSSSRLGQGAVGPNLRSGQGAGYHVPPAPHSAQDQQEQSVTNESTLLTTTATPVFFAAKSTTEQVYDSANSFSSATTNTSEVITTENALKNLNWDSRLGSGSFGKVYLCHCQDTGEEIAAKVIDIHPDLKEKDLVCLEKEISMLQDLQHNRIVTYYGTRRQKDCVQIFMEYMAGGSLRKYVRDHGPLNENLTRKYTKQLLEGVEYLHSRNIVHRDIKGDNVLRDLKGNVKIADFGTCKHIQTIYMSEEKAGTCAGTWHWMAPEMFKSKPSTTKSDVWSVGCTIVEMLTGKPPCHDLDYYALVLLVGGDDPMEIQLPPHCSNVVHSFVISCFAKDVSSRPTAADLLSHDFLSPSSVPTAACAAPKADATVKPSTEQSVADHTTIPTTYGSAIQQCTTDVDPSGQSSSPTNATSAYDTNTAPTTATSC